MAYWVPRLRTSVSTARQYGTRPIYTVEFCPRVHTFRRFSWRRFAGSIGPSNLTVTLGFLALRNVAVGQQHDRRRLGRRWRRRLQQQQEEREGGAACVSTYNGSSPVTRRSTAHHGLLFQVRLILAQLTMGSQHIPGPILTPRG